MPPPKDPIKYSEYIQKQSESHKGQTSPMKNKKHNFISIYKMKQSHKGKCSGDKNPFFNKNHTPESIEKIKLAARNRGDIWKQKLREKRIGKPAWNKGIPTRESTKQKLRECQLGEKSWKYGKPLQKNTIEKIRKALLGKPKSEETCKKISKSRKGKCCKDRNPMYIDGRSHLPYCFKFNEDRRKAVRDFFGGYCICCGKHTIENITKNGVIKNLSVHHIDHDKKQGCNGNPFNLVPLCIVCHTKEMYTQTEYKVYINKTLNSGFEWGIWSREQYEKEVMYP